MKFKGVIFDFNGTLFYDTPFHNTAWQRIVKELTGSDLDDDLRVKMHGKNNRDILHCINKNISDEDIISYSKRKEAIYRDICLENPDKLHLVNGAIELFNYLKEHNIPFTIASASIKENIDFFVESFNLDKWIDPEMIIYDDGSYSNKVNMFKDAAQKLKHNVKDILVFEDSFSGIANAYKAGIEKIVVVCPQEKESEYRDLPGVIMTIQDFSDFNKLI